MSIQWAVGRDNSWSFISFVFLPATDCLGQINHGVAQMDYRAGWKDWFGPCAYHISGQTGKRVIKKNPFFKFFVLCLLVFTTIQC